MGGATLIFDHSGACFYKSLDKCVVSGVSRFSGNIFKTTAGAPFVNLIKKKPKIISPPLSNQHVYWHENKHLFDRPDFCIFIVFSDMYFRRIVLFPADWLGMLRILHMDTVASCISMKPEDQNALMAWRLVNWVRCLAEDLPQCFFQSLSSIWVSSGRDPGDA